MRETSQQQTLSVRIGDGLRKKLERARELEAARTGQAVSVSEVAKKLLESGREDRLEVVDLLSEPTAALARIRRKAGAGHVLSRAEWIVVCHFVSKGLEAFSTVTPRPLPSTSIVAVVDAFQALMAERTSDSSVLNEVYLQNSPSERTPTPELTDEALRQILDDARQRILAGAGNRFLLLGRNLCTFLEEECDTSLAAIDRVLRKHWEALWLIAARGHYADTKSPVRSEMPLVSGAPPIAPVTDGQYTVSVALGGDVDIAVLLGCPTRRGLRYALSGYPHVSEFRTMLDALGAPKPAARRWHGQFFVGDCVAGQDADEVWFRGIENGISVGFSISEWAAVRSLSEAAFAVPDVAIAWERLVRDYGEL